MKLIFWLKSCSTHLEFGVDKKKNWITLRNVDEMFLLKVQFSDPQCPQDIIQTDKLYNLKYSNDMLGMQ